MSDGRRDYAVLISLATREEAEVAAAALRADGIDAFIGNSNHGAADWGLLPAMGGVQIMVPFLHLDEAKAALQERIKGDATAAMDEFAGRRDRYKVWITLVWLGAGILLFGSNAFNRQALEDYFGTLHFQAQMARDLRDLCASPPTPGNPALCEMRERRGPTSLPTARSARAVRGRS